MCCETGMFGKHFKGTEMEDTFISLRVNFVARELTCYYLILEYFYINILSPRFKNQNEYKIKDSYPSSGVMTKD